MSVPTLDKYECDSIAAVDNVGSHVTGMRYVINLLRQAGLAIELICLPTGVLYHPSVSP